MKVGIQPLEQQGRIQALDVMRGFSLLGIFIVNMISFHSPIYYYDPYSWWGDSVNAQTYWFINVFVQASFYPIFAMMFGAGLAIQHYRMKEKGQSFTGFAIKRLAVLLVIGIIHAFLVWSGDILITYAVTGFFLIWMLTLSGKMLLILGFIIYFLPQTLLAVILIFASAVDPTTVTNFSSVQGIESSINNYGAGTIGEILNQRMDDWLVANNTAGFVSIVIAILPLMMIGAGIAKTGLLRRASEKKKMIGVLAAVFLAAGLVVKTIPYWAETNLAYDFMQDFVGGPLLSLAYMAIIALAMTSSLMAKLLSPLAKTGRMSLTNYLLQSVIGTLIFYNYGLGLYGEVTLLTGTLMALGIFIMQVILSEIWLSKFKQGPMESIWRKLTYPKTQKISK
nr:DUF418 domain-containing protein [Jeotgalibacillus sp. R-1-5s-1]